MGEKKGGSDHINDGEKKKEKKEQGDGGNKDEGKPLTAVFKVEVHCEGCGSKIMKAARGVAGVENVKVDCDKNKLTVVGEVDPVKLRDKLESKLKKKIELISPQPKQKEDQKSENKKPEDENKSKEQKKPPPATTAVLKMNFHCDGCIEKIHHILSKTDEVDSISFDKQKDLVEVRGTMDVKSICELLEKRMKRAVEIVPPKSKEDGKEKKETAQKMMEAAGDGGRLAEYNRMMMMPMPPAAHPGYGYGYGYGQSFAPGYPSYPVQNVHAPQMFSDENPNACSVM
uniref:HMA domain-containing protein n=1 Tax=Kalanchoe fedtschenkoi TaxID=63787 RepID=A0A7N0RCZ4_KALFE